eukprot:CAMPEP_0170856922 /NCGR_PEP_ID=MMETSP0734-20130129/14926_1 /TAXON_ID=186038 /ORGANISM="Fragilariopsis kerguelensis, Strain L26-C5" /LENGTH=200 /DNA_ID=CAMNT_0011228943 /DNA_START=31 /DNA_END=633 /DNA_ORIENTATION=+
MKGGLWTTEEHQQFMRGYDKWGHGNWKQISEDFVPTRTNKQICSYAIKCFGTNKIGKNGTTGGPWTTEEKEQFWIGYHACGHGNWTQLHDDYLPTRTNKQICSHALMQLGPEHFTTMKRKRKEREQQGNHNIINQNNNISSDGATTTTDNHLNKTTATTTIIPKKGTFDDDDDDKDNDDDDVATTDEDINDGFFDVSKLF